MNERLKKLRKTLDLTQQDFANRIGVKRNTVATYEMGRSSPSDSAVSLICREFNVNENWLRNGGTDDDMFIKLNEDEELAMYTQMLLDSTTDDVIANLIKKFICIYEKLDPNSKKILMNIADELIDNQKNNNSVT
ncbi:MAG: helix-turn-helix domain-containing protein [Lachnospiraceae bacterium]